MEAHSYTCLTPIRVSSSLKAGLYCSLSLVASELCPEIKTTGAAIPQPLFCLEPDIDLGAFLLSFPLSFWAVTAILHASSIHLASGDGACPCARHDRHLQQAHRLEEVADSYLK